VKPKEDIMTTQTPEKFVVGETVSFYHGEDHYPVEVIGVDGDKVLANVFGEVKVFAPRSDGKHVVEGSRDTDVLPDMIFHSKRPVPEETLRDRLTDRFDRVLDCMLHPIF
jgi:ribosomal protein S19